MKKMVLLILVCFCVVTVLGGCGKQSAEQKPISQSVAIGNPWSNWASIEEAEVAVGFSFGLSEVIAENFTATTFRTLSNELIEVTYYDAENKICVRKQLGEGQDISGDYNKYDTCTEESIDGGTSVYYHNSGNNAVKLLVSHNGYSWSLVAPNGYGADSDWEFVSAISGYCKR